jgi:glycosyltransferase involved in cell wall biosynthesis
VRASIVVPTYRGAERLPGLLDSLAGQVRGTAPFEVVLVIDGIDDGTVEIARREYRVPLRHILLPENRGRVEALNTGFAAARGEVLIRCDDDLVVPTGYVAAHIAAHEGSTTVGVVGPTRDVHSPTPYAHAYGFDAAERSYAHVLSSPSSQRWRLWAASCSVSRSTWDEIGPYDDRYRGYGWEDVDYGYRLHAAGIPIEIITEATAEHHGPARTAHARAVKAFDAGRARATFRGLHPEALIGEPTAGGGVWGVGVAAAARALGRSGAVERRARWVDLVLPYVPRQVGRKLVALAVEGAGLAGDMAASTRGAEH